MLKWILGILAVIILAVAGTCFYGYKKLTGGGNSVTITMAGTPERIFAAIATPDSMVHWMTASQIEGPLGKGMLAAGDTLRLRGPRAAGRQQRGGQLLQRRLGRPRGERADAAGHGDGLRLGRHPARGADPA